MSGDLSAKILIGCQAWTKGDWETQPGGPAIFYPMNIKDNERLAFYSKIFDTVEADTSFYGVPNIEKVEGWYRQTPGDFIFSLKMSKDVTHRYSLQEESYPIVQLLLSRASVLKEKLGAILIQLPARFKKAKRTLKDLQNFLEILPRETRFAIEFRSADWFVPEVFALLAERNIAICLGAGQFIPLENIIDALYAPSADFSYMRFAGPRNMTVFDRIRRPQDEILELWKKKVEDLQKAGKTVFVYFNNHFEGFSPGSAVKFREMLGQKFIYPQDLDPARSLF